MEWSGGPSQHTCYKLQESENLYIYSNVLVWIEEVLNVFFYILYKLGRLTISIFEAVAKIFIILKEVCIFP